MRRYRWITVGLVFAALAVSTTAATASASSRSEIAAVRHAWAGLATASVKGPASTICEDMTVADAQRYFNRLFGTPVCISAAIRELDNWKPAALTACGRHFLSELPAQVTKGLGYLSYQVLSATQVQVRSTSANYLFEAADTETWQDIHGRWVVAHGLPPIYTPQCGG